MSSIISERIFRKFETAFRPHIAAVGLSTRMFSDPAYEFSTDKYIELLETVAKNGHPDIGLEMGDALEHSDLGVLGHAMASAKTLGQALDIMSRYIIVFSHDNSIRVDVTPARFTITYGVERPDILDRRQDVELAMTSIYRLMSRSVNEALKPLLIEFEHPMPSDTRKHRELFSCDLRFSRGRNRIFFPRDVMDWQQINSDGRLLGVLEAHLSDQLQARSQEQDIVLKAKRLIAAELHNGLPPIDLVAGHLGLSRRSLQRRLSNDGKTYSDLVEEVRTSIARDYVRHSDMKISEIAYMLCYNESSSFSRAYSRWIGCSPIEYRSQHFAVDQDSARLN